MTVWLVWTEHGEYENYSRDLEGVFTSKVLADEFADIVNGEVEEVPLLDAPPVRATLYTWADHVAADGRLSPEALHGCPHLGRKRSRWPTWQHQAPSLTSRVDPWSGKDKPDLYVEVIGTDRAAVKAEYRRLVAEARARLKEPVHD